MKSELKEHLNSGVASSSTHASGDRYTEENNKRVHFAPTNGDIDVIHSSSGKIVRRMLWTDHAGVTGRDTGRVNKLMQPHGHGVLVYNHRTFNTCIWVNGNPTKLWMPKQSKKLKRRNISRQQSSGTKNDTYLPHLDLGDVATPQLMVVRSHLSHFDSLRRHDFVFIQRSDQQWTYAIIADRRDDAIKLVVDTAGSTKIISRGNWFKSVRLVSRL